MAKDEHRKPGDNDEQSASHAADEPTAVWDLEALRNAGLSDLIEFEERPETGPVTAADGMASKRPSVIVADQGLAGSGPVPARAATFSPVAPALARPAPQRSGRGGLRWIVLLGLSALAGALAYAAMRFLR